MLVKILAVGTVIFVIANITAAASSSSSLVLRDSNTSKYSSRSGTNYSGRTNSNGVWIFYSSRSAYEGFQGGGPGSGK
ncbi:hypothetical protein [Calothrix sp. UHCC 0171]|uniref:hypothetical protein n=1 Tax=Calothrix sp. UHCC 0171 TaxID=3110245 RepID=UPI002B1FB80E|nr:hypothetical protein [Calothrix sp. UHCC 0171]MEA5572954.1 hypothetical protein [Calothrix sp. UHCC 0171]